MAYTNLGFTSLAVIAMDNNHVHVTNSNTLTSVFDDVKASDKSAPKQVNIMHTLS